MIQQHLIITKSPTGRYSAFVDPHPEQMSDFRDADGRSCEVVATMPIETAIAAPDLLAACESAKSIVRDSCRGDQPENYNQLLAAIVKAQPQPIDTAVADGEG